MKKLLFVFALLCMGSISLAQTAKKMEPVITRTFYYYTFSGVQNEQQLSKVETEINSLQFVEGTKTKYKPEKQAAQVIVTVAVPNNGSEERNEFNLVQLKQILISNNLTPGELTIRDEAKQ